jgi:hypothetical protein
MAARMARLPFSAADPATGAQGALLSLWKPA